MGASPARRQCRSMRPRSLVAPNGTQKARPENLVVAATAIAEASPFPRHRTKTPRECPGGRRGRPKRPGTRDSGRAGRPKEAGGRCPGRCPRAKRTESDRRRAKTPINRRKSRLRRRAAPNTTLPKSRDGLATALRALGFEWRYNLRAMRAELREQGGTWSPATDRLICDIRSQIPERFSDAGGDGDKPKPLAFGRTAWEDCFGALLHRAEVDPFREWLESLPAWDRTPRLDSWLSTVFLVRESGGLAAWCKRIPSARGRVADLPPRNQARRIACSASTTFAAWRRLFLPVPVVVNRDQQR